MIRLDISTLTFFYTLFSAVIILIIWAIFGYRAIKRPAAKEADGVWKCSVCYNTYIDSKDEEMSVCPLCGSYNKREVAE